MTVRVVDMRPEHLPSAARIQVEAFRGYMNARLGPRYAQAMLNWFLNTQGTISLVAIEDERVLGYVVGAPGEYGRGMSRAIMPAAIFAALLRPWLAFSGRIRRRAVERVRAMFTKAQPKQSPAQALNLPAPVMSLVAIGVSTAARGKGAGALLMREFEQRSRALSMRSMRLSVYTHNSAARALYEKAGWTAAPGSAEGELSFIRLLT